MKKFILLIVLLLGWNLAWAQTGTDAAKDKTGLLSIAGVKVKVGFTVTYFKNFNGDYVYILQPDSHVVEHVENKYGTALSIVTLIPFDKEGAFNFLLNLSLKDYKNFETDKDGGFFNSQTPFGVGFAVFPFPGARFFGFTLMANFGRQNRMRQEAVASEYFPIASHTDYGLKVAAPVPDGLLSPYYLKENTYTANIGITIRI